MQTVATITPDAMLAQVRKDNPSLCFALSDNGTAVGVWHEVDRRYFTVCGLCSDGRWVKVGDLFVNGKPVTTYHNSTKDRVDALLDEEPRCFNCGAYLMHDGLCGACQQWEAQASND